MKKITALLVLTLAFIGSSFADTPIALAELPQSVTEAIQNYFPSSKAISAKKDVDPGKEKYEVKVQYKDLLIKVELLPTGQIVDLEM